MGIISDETDFFHHVSPDLQNRCLAVARATKNRSPCEGNRLLFYAFFSSYASLAMNLAAPDFRLAAFFQWITFFLASLSNIFWSAGS